MLEQEKQINLMKDSNDKAKPNQEEEVAHGLGCMDEEDSVSDGSSDDGTLIILKKPSKNVFD